MASPKLRFKEFSRDWKVSTIGEKFSVTSGTTPSRSESRFFENGVINWVKTTDLNNGLLNLTEEKVSDLALEKTSLKVLPKGTIFIAMYGGFNQIGRTALITEPATCNQALSAIYPNNKFEPLFLLHYLNNRVDDWKYYAASSRKDPNITKNDVLSFPISYPELQEQTKIANFLTAVDKKISQLNEQHQLMIQYKKGVMQKIFSQEIRFKDDNGEEFGEWEEKKLGKLCCITTGKLDANAMVENGKYRFYTCAKEFYHIDNFAFDSEALLISGNGANVGYIHYYNGKFNAYQRTYVLEKWTENIIYVKFFLEHFLKGRINIGKNEGNTPYIVLSVLTEMPILLPCLNEQAKIADFITKLECKIENLSSQLKLAKEWKKGLLQQMFV